MKRQLKEYFYFSKSEKRGIVILSILIIVLLLLKHFLHHFIPTPQVDTELVKKIVAENSAALVQEINDEDEPKLGTETPFYKSKTEQELFFFNPNKVSASELKQLGCSDKLIKTWLNFISKGGNFSVKQDVKKIYGLTPSVYTKLEPFILLDNTHQGTAINKATTQIRGVNFSAKTDAKTEKKTIIDINTADTLQLKYLPGIGSKFAARIIAYRNKLGGFIKKEQLKEVFGIDSALYNKIENSITIDQTNVQKLSINSVQVANLKQHPYFSYHVANAIVQYRDRHGNYSTVEEVKKVVVVSETIFKKISPYLKL